MTDYSIVQKRFHKPRLAVLVMASCVTAGATFSYAPAHAATYTWSSMAASTNWSAASNWGGMVPGSGDVGLFNAAAYASQPSLSSSAALGTLWDTGSAALTIGGTNSLTLYGTTLNSSTGVGIELDASASTLTINSPLKLESSQQWINNSVNAITINGNISSVTSGLTLTKLGSGVLTLTGSNAIGTSILTVDAGTLSVPSGSLSAAFEYIGYSGTGDFTQSGGTNKLSGPMGYIYIGYISGSSGNYYLSGSGLLSGESEYVGYDGSGSITETSGTNSVGGSLYIGADPGSSGAYNLTGKGLLTGNFELVGYTGSGSVIQSGGTNSATQGLYLGDNAGGSGTYKLSGSGDVSMSNEYIGSSGNGNFIQSGGSNSVSAGGNFYIGYNPGSSGAYTLTGGTLSAPNEYLGDSSAGSFAQSAGMNTVSAGGTLAVAYSLGSSGVYSLSGSGVLSSPYEYIGVSGSGSFLQSGGTNVVTGGLVLGQNANSSGTYSLNGGLLSLSGSGLIEEAGNAAFNFSGGTFQAGSSLTTVVPILLATAGSNQAFDTQGNSLTLDGLLFGPGGLQKLGSGTLILATSNSFTGTTLVSNGTLLLANTGALVDSTFDSSGSGALSFGALTSAAFGGLTGPGNLTLTNTASAAVLLTVGSTNASATFSGVLSGAGGLAKAGSGSFTLAGSNTYLGSTTVAAGTLALDFSQPDAPSSNIVNNATNASSLVMAGGVLAIQGNVNATNSQTFNGLQVSPGTSAIVVTSASSNSVLLSLGSVSRSQGGTVDFILPSGAQSASNGITTTTANTNGILGGYATVSGTDWATSSGTAGNIIAYGGYTTGDLGTLASSGTLNAEPTGPQNAITSAATFNTLNLTGTTGVTMTGSGSLTLAAGGLIGNSSGIISGGTLLGAAGGDLIAITPQNLTIASVIADNSAATGLTKAGSATLTLSVANSFTGTTLVGGGMLLLANTAALAGSTFDTSGAGALSFGTLTSAVFAGLQGSGDLSLNNAMPAAVALTVGGNNASTTFSGNFSGAGNLTKIGSGVFTISGSSTVSGTLTADGGTLSMPSGYLSTPNQYIGYSGSASFTQGGGTNSAASLVLGQGSSAAGTYNLNGGMLTLSGLTQGLGSAVLNFNGGTLRAGASFSTGVPIVLATSGSNDTLDTNGNSVTLAGTISGPGGLTTAGTGAVTLSGSNSYAGGTTISGGVVSFNAINAVPATGTILIRTSGALTATTIYNVNSPVSSWLSSGRIVANPSGAIALPNGISDTENITFSGTSAALSLGAIGSATYGGTLTTTGANLNLGGGGGTLHFTSSLNTAGNLILGNQGVAGGTVVLTGSRNLVSGSLTVDSGTLQISSGSVSVSGNEIGGNSGTGGFVQSGGTNSVTGIPLNGAYVSLCLGTNAGSSGTYQMSGGLLSVTYNEAIGYDGTGSFTQSGGTHSVAISTGLYLGFGFGNGSYSLSGSGLLSCAGQEFIDNGSFNQSGGTNSVSQAFNLGDDGGTGNYNLSGSGILSAGESIGLLGFGVFNQSGGTNSALTLSLGYDNGGGGTYNMYGGLLSGTGNNIIGGFGSGSFNQSGGTTSLPSGVHLAQEAGSTGAYNLDGGLLTISGSGLMQGAGSASFTFSGGTLQAGSSFATNIPIVLATAGSNGTFDTEGNTLTLTASLSGPGGFQKAGPGTLILSTSNTYTGTTLVANGTLLLKNIAALSGSTFDASGAGSLSFGTLTSATFGSLQGSGNLTLNNASAAAVALTVGGNGSSTTFSGGLGGAGSLTKVGSGNLLMSGASTFFGGTSIFGGTITLGFNQPGAPMTNILYDPEPPSTLTLGGSVLVIEGSPGTANSQTFNSLVVNPGASAIVLIAAASNSLILNLGSITRNAGGTVDFTLPNGVQSASNGITTTTANTNGILGGWATVSGTDWAASSGTAGNIVAYTGYTNGDLGTLSSNGTLNVEPTGPQSAVTSAVSFNTLNLTGTTGVTMSDSGSLTLASGGLIGNTSGTITGGTLGSAIGELIVITPQNLTIASAIAATSLTKAGTGVLTLLPTNGFSGTTLVGDGALFLSSSNAATSTTVNVAVNNGLQFAPGIGTFDIGAVGGVGSLNLADTGGNAVTIVTGGNNASTTYSGAISGAGTLVHGGSGTLVLAGSNTFSGGLVLAQDATPGMVCATSPASLGSGPITFTGNNTLCFMANMTVPNSIAINSSQMGNIDTEGYTVALSGLIGGSGTMNKVDSGTVILSDSNSLSGTTAISQGTLQLANAAAVQNSTVNVNADNGLQFSPNIGAFTVGGLSGSGAVALSDATGMAVNVMVGGNNQNTTYSGMLSGAGTLTKAGSGSLDLMGNNNSWTGGLFFDPGVVAFNSDAALGAPNNPIIFLGSGTLQAQGPIALSASRSITIASGATASFDPQGNTLTLAGPIGGQGGLAVTSAVAGGTVVLTNTDTYSGGTIVTSGALEAATTAALPGAFTPGKVNVAGSATLVLEVGGTQQWTAAQINSLVAANSGSFSPGASLGLDTDGGNFNLGSVNMGGIGLAIVGSNALTLTGSSSYPGVTSVSQGTLQLANSAALAESTLAINVDNGLEFSPGVGTFYLGGLEGGNRLALADTSGGAVELVVGGNGASTSFSGQIGGTGELMKTGPGTLLLGGSNSYTGGTNVAAGTLLLADAAALPAGASLDVGDFALFASMAPSDSASEGLPADAAVGPTFELHTVPEPGSLLLAAALAMVAALGSNRRRLQKI